MALTISGISNPVLSVYGNLYMINNPIKVQVSNTDAYDWLDVDITPSGQEMVSLRLYPNSNNYLEFDLAEVMKALFVDVTAHNLYTSPSYVVDNNILKALITFRPITDFSGPAPTIYNLIFVRGGHNSLSINRTINGSLNLTDKPIYWIKNNIVFPSATYLYNSNTGLITKTVTTLSTVDSKRMPVRNCEGTYIKFLNSLGGFSYWYFDDSLNTLSTSNEGYILNYTEITDLGVDLNERFTITTKVPKEYLHIIKDLIYSPMVLVYGGNLVSGDPIFTRVILDSNSIAEDPTKESSFVTLRLQKITTYNPSVSW